MGSTEAGDRSHGGNDHHSRARGDGDGDLRPLGAQARRAGVSFVADMIIVTAAVHIVLVAHLSEIVNYTTLGYGNVIMTPSWRLLWPLEAANGMLLFGVSTAIIFTVIQRLLYARFADLRP